MKLLQAIDTAGVVMKLVIQTTPNVQLLLCLKNKLYLTAFVSIS